MSVSVDVFGKIEGRDVRRFTLQSKAGGSVQVIEYGAIITTIKVPDSNNKIDDVTMGFDTLEGYLESPVKPYFGAIVGRVANRIGQGRFKIADKSYQVSLNREIYHLHGGVRGFDKQIWDGHVEGNKVTFSYLSQDGEEGYPGQVLSQVTYWLGDDNDLNIDMLATATKPTPINLANHAYFNLAGHDAGSTELMQHEVMINADAMTVVDSNSIPTGELKHVSGTIFDLRTSKKLDDVMSLVPGGGYDHNFCVNLTGRAQKTIVARVVHKGSGRMLEVFADQPGVQFYTGNFLPQDDILKGKDGKVYQKQGAFCLETQNFPDAINNPNFPNCILYPGQIYLHKVTYKFSTV